MKLPVIWGNEEVGETDYSDSLGEYIVVRRSIEDEEGEACKIMQFGQKLQKTDAVVMVKVLVSQEFLQTDERREEKINSFISHNIGWFCSYGIRYRNGKKVS